MWRRCTKSYKKGNEKMKRNMDIRNYAKERGVKLWEIAEVIGICDGNFSRRLRRELPPAEKQRIKEIIDNINAQER